MEFTLTFSDNQWVCYNAEFKIAADSLDEIDTGIEKYLSTIYPSGKIQVKMFFDFDRFPQWHRQYMPHYFNRDLTFEINTQSDN